ncbi:hypothetical protein [Rhinolophus gammaherpesvirus 1]|uniref:Uncharacterized protein n=1 Tax=Rhinolophus gammaherpesvirus 1 TaxID=2054179 RepID=A0A2Z5U649_9GAMA|nr:hypothetical protein [Rhinolophus gammaherpesvirus 1]BBB06479.1 hypothetical protein [Rhinolophus gammaherpesvirus 1]
MSLTEGDFQECLDFFYKPLPKLLTICSTALEDLGQLESVGQKVERVCLFLETAGTECVKEVMLMRESYPQDPNVGSPEGAASKR